MDDAASTKTGLTLSSAKLKARIGLDDRHGQEVDMTAVQEGVVQTLGEVEGQSIRVLLRELEYARSAKAEETSEDVDADLLRDYKSSLRCLGACFRSLQTEKEYQKFSLRISTISYRKSVHIAIVAGFLWLLFNATMLFEGSIVKIVVWANMGIALFCLVAAYIYSWTPFAKRFLFTYAIYALTMTYIGCATLLIRWQEDDNETRGMLIIEIIVFYLVVQMRLPFLVAGSHMAVFCLFAVLLSIYPVTGMPPPMNSYVLLGSKMLFLWITTFVVGTTMDSLERRMFYSIMSVREVSLKTAQQDHILHRIMSSQIPDSVLTGLFKAKEEIREVDPSMTPRQSTDVGKEGVVDLKPSVVGGDHDPMINPSTYGTVVFVNWQDMQVAQERKNIGSVQVVNELNALVDSLESIASEYNMERVRCAKDVHGTVADRIPVQIKVTNANVIFASMHGENEFMMAANAVSFALSVISKRDGLEHLVSLEANMRIGVATGWLVTGILGTSMWCYDIWGATVNKSSRLCNYCPINEITICNDTYLGLPGNLRSRFSQRTANLKGLGPISVHVCSSVTSEEDISEALMNDFFPGGATVGEMLKKAKAMQVADDDNIFSGESRSKIVWRGRPLLGLTFPDPSRLWYISWIRFWPLVFSYITRDIMLEFGLRLWTMRFTSAQHESNYTKKLFHQRVGRWGARILAGLAGLVLCILSFAIILENDFECFEISACWAPASVLSAIFVCLVLFPTVVLTFTHRYFEIIGVACLLMMFLWLGSMMAVVTNDITRIILARLLMVTVVCSLFLMGLRFPFSIIFIWCSILGACLVQAATGLFEFGAYLSPFIYLFLISYGSFQLELLGRRLYMLGVLRKKESAFLVARKRLYSSVLLQIYPPKVAKFIFNLQKEKEEDEELEEFVMSKLKETDLAGSLSTRSPSKPSGSEDSNGRLKEGRTSSKEGIVETMHQCFVLQTDLVGFTEYCNGIPAKTIVSHLSRLLEAFDNQTQKLKAFKVKTVGDAYIAMNPGGTNLLAAMKSTILLALKLRKACRRTNKELGTKFVLRLGIGCGESTLCLLGKTRMTMDLIGQGVHEASLMEQHGRPDMINISLGIVNIMAGRHNDKNNQITNKNQRDFRIALEWLMENVLYPEHPDGVPLHLLSIFLVDGEQMPQSTLKATKKKYIKWILNY